MYLSNACESRSLPFTDAETRHRRQTNYTSCSSFMHQCSHSIVKGEQISQAQSALCEAMLAASSHFPVTHISWHIFQRDLFHDLTGHRGEADWSVVPRVLLFTLFKNRCNVSIFPVTGDFTWWILRFFRILLL